MNFLLSQGSDARHESRRIVLGLVALALLALAAVNVTAYRAQSERLAHQAWQRLLETTEDRRDQVVALLLAWQREARSIAHDPQVAALGARFARGTASEADRATFREEIASDVLEYELNDIQLFDARGQLVFDHRPLGRAGNAEDGALARRAGLTGQATFGGTRGNDLAFAVPLAAQDHEAPPVLVFHADAHRTLSTVLAHWPGFGASAGSYLVRREGERAVILTSLADGRGRAAGAQFDLSDPHAMDASMAATGVESHVEVAGPAGVRVWAVTRALPGIGWGIVGQADRADLMGGLKSTRQGLALLDLVVLLLGGALGLLWRRIHVASLQRHEAQLTLRHAERVQAIFDTAFDAIFTFDRAGRIRSVNRAAGEMFGRTATDMDGQPLHRFLRWGDSGRQSALPAAGSVGTGEALRPDGTTMPVEFSLGHTGEGQDRVHTAIVRDVRERVDSERRIRAFAEGLEHSNRRLEEMNAQLEEASRLKSEFLANTSHELRTPLNGMIGFLQLVLDGMCDSPEEERDFLKQALQCSRHLLGLINDVLDIAKIEAGKLTLEIDRIDVQQLFDEVYTLTHVQAAQKGLSLAMTTEVGEGLCGRGDFGKTKQILVNLVGNALKFTPKGSITVRAIAHEDVGHLMFEVVDTGIGIPPERQKVIFDKFVQGDGSTTRRFGGTGLGLAISRSLVELMGGIIGVQSPGAGHGTRMYFSLPLWREALVPDPAQEATRVTEVIQGPAGGALVLIVEDDPVFRRFLTAVLQQHGYRTVEADHAEAGWLLLRRLQPACVLLDYALSCGDNAQLRTGWDLAQRITSDAKTRHIPLVFVTGFDGELTEKLKATAFARRPEHLVKPIDAAVLRERIETLVGPASHSVLRVLMADDDPTVAAYVRKVLPESRFHVEVANNGEECLHILRTQPNGFDLLLLDLMMPEVSGYDVLREMTLAGIRPDLPVVVLTNFPEPRNEEERRLLERGLVLDVIAKTAVHDNPALLPHVLDWHLQVSHEQGETGEPPIAEAA